VDKLLLVQIEFLAGTNRSTKNHDQKEKKIELLEKFCRLIWRAAVTLPAHGPIFGDISPVLDLIGSKWRT
jgi:hypothetical protein